MILNKYLFARKSRLAGGHTVLCAVEAYDKDHAVTRLVENFPYTERMDWDFLEMLDPEHFCGALGHDLPLHTKPPFAKKKTLLN